MKKKAVTIEASQLIGCLDQELKELPDNRKGDNKLLLTAITNAY